MSRTCGGEVFFDDLEKEALRRLLWKMSEFCGVRVITYCVMGNHFHALVEVPKREVWLERFSEKDARQTMLAIPHFLATIPAMNPSQIPENQPPSLEDQLIGINAKTAPYPAAKKMPGKQCLPFHISSPPSPP